MPREQRTVTPHNRPWTPDPRFQIQDPRTRSLSPEIQPEIFAPQILAALLASLERGGPSENAYPHLYSGGTPEESCTWTPR